tara:strand:+ start:3928 stop:6051 length:2124 start_codon:yes stop_codon:yes gene_type:complete
MSNGNKKQTIQTQNEKIKKSERETITTVTPGGVLAASFAYGSEAWQLLSELDQTLTDLANADLGKFGCKGAPDRKTEIEGCVEKCIEDGNSSADCNTKCALQVLAGCASYADSFIKAADAETPIEKTSLILEGVLDLVDEILGAQSVNDKLRQCTERQFRRFLRAIPVQYYLLILLSKIAKSAKNPKTIFDSQEVPTACKNKVQTAIRKEYENFLPQIDLPLIPRLPYINIPDLTDVVAKIVAEYFCFTFCVVTTPIIQKTAAVALGIGDAWADSWSDDDNNPYGNLPPLVKVPINSYVSDEAISGAIDNRLVSQIPNLSKPNYIFEIRNYISKIQEREDIGQEEFIFLFLGKASCNILNKIKDPDIFPETKRLFSGVDANSLDSKIIQFFSFLGSFLNFIKLAEDSRGNVCPPDPCDVKGDDPAISAINSLCALLDPDTTLPPIPINAIMSKTGANDFIINNSYEGYKIIPQVSEVYTFKVNDVPTNYISSYRDQAAIVSKKLSDGGINSNTNTGILIELKKASLVIYDTKFMKINMPFPIPDISLPVPDFDNPKEILLGDPTLELKPFEDSANNYWIESAPGNLKFTKSKLGIALVEFKQADLAAKLFEPMIFSYLANTFPYALVDIINSPERKNNFPIYQKGWKQEDSVVVDSTPQQIAVYNRYTKPALRIELEEIQSSDNNKQVEDVNNDMKEFIRIRKDLLG